MKRFYYDNRIAKILLAFSSCHTITIGPFVLSKLSPEHITQRVRNHETCHSYQWIETTCVAVYMVLVLQLISYMVYRSDSYLLYLVCDRVACKTSHLSKFKNRIQESVV